MPVRCRRIRSGVESVPAVRGEPAGPDAQDVLAVPVVLGSAYDTSADDLTGGSFPRTPRLAT